MTAQGSCASRSIWSGSTCSSRNVLSLLEEALALLDGRRSCGRLGMDQVEPEVAEEQLLAEARQLPLGFARCLDDLPCLAFGGVDGHEISSPWRSVLRAG